MPACSQCATEFADGAQFCGNCGAVLPLPDGQADPWLGRTVDGRYRVITRIGSGGMGVVYRVEHLRLGKTAAMKVLAPEVAGKAEMIQRFHLEAQAVSRLNHPNIVQTFDFGQFESALYLIMEHVKGDDLGAVLKREGPLPFARAAKLFVQACSALTEAHDHGIIHRDLKPENLMVQRRRDGSEHIKVLDFGLAKLRERDESASITTGKQILGTPYYISPEQVRGETLDPRADVYSLGATLYRVLTGAPPFQAPSPMAVLSKHITEPVVPPRTRAPDRELPPEADQIVLRAMAKKVEDRYPSAAAVQEDLERVLAGGTPVSASASAPAAPPLLAPRAREAPTLTLTESDAVLGVERDSDELSRQDLERFERVVRRRRVLARLALPLGIAAIAGGAFAVTRLRAEKPASVEHEPNNTLGYANLLASGRPIRGSIGAALEGGQPDVDFFRIPVGHGDRVVRARLDGVPGIDLVLELFDGQGRRLAKSDAAGRGGGEWLQPFSIGPAEAYLSVREFWVEGQTPTEDPNDSYVLTATWGPPAAGWEIEPNDWEAVATPMAAGTSMRGYLGDADDKDWFAITPATSGQASGHLHVVVDPPDGVDVVILTEGGKHVTNKGGPGDNEELVLPTAAGEPALVGVTRTARKTSDKASDKAPDRTSQTTAKDEELVGLDAPYEVRVDVVP